MMTFLGVYGKILQPFGFFMYRGSFYKVDEKRGMVWLVTMYTGPEGVYRSLRFGCRPFCHAIEKEWLQSDGSYQLDALYRRWNMQGRLDMNKFGANRDYDMDIGRQIFCEEVLNRFVEIRTPEDCRRFAEWYFQRISDDNFPVERLNTIYTVWEYIQMQQYNEALIALPIARKNWEGGQNAKVASPEERQQTLDAFRKTELLLESKEYTTLQQLLQKRIEYSKCVCEDYFKNG